MFGERKSLFVREQASLLKLRDTYDLLDAETQVSLGQAKDEPAAWAKWLRLLVKKAMLPTTLNVYAGGKPEPILSIHKRPALFRTRLEIRDGFGRPIAGLQSRVFTLGGAFRILDPSGQDMGELKGDWKGWDYSASLRGEAIGIVTKKWAGVLKEVFTNADQYLVQADRPENLPLMLGMALSIDLVYKERQG
ncbi:MAG: oxidoreductase [Holophagaceae bacterium]|nr:oxidoreductase [Holophagaceae bacterium]